MPIATVNGGSSPYVELEQDTFLAYPFNATTKLVFDGGIVGQGGTGITLNVAQDTVTLVEAGFYLFTAEVSLAYSADVTGYELVFAGWHSQVGPVGVGNGNRYALVSAGDYFAAGATLQLTVNPNTGAGNSGGSSNFAFASIAKVG